MQSDLFVFPSDPSAKPKTPKFSFLDRYRLTLRCDQVLLGVIAFIVLYVFIFSAGVEKGKGFALDELKAERGKREHMIRELRERFGPTFVKQVNLTEPEDAPEVTQAKISTVTEKPPIKDISQEEVAKPQPKATQAPSYPEGKYTIQLITYMTQSAADRQISQLSNKGHRGFIVPSGKYLQVCVNAFESRQKAMQGLLTLRSQGIAPQDAYVRMIPH